MHNGVDAALSAADVEWLPVSPRLATAQRGVTGAALAVVAVAVLGALLVLGAPIWSLAAAVVVPLAVFGWAWWLIGRRVRAWAYAERADDLLVTSGILVRRLVVVPYGRMQLVDVVAGPIDRRLGITTVQLHTASASTGAAIPGLEPQVAAALRDRLAARGEERTAGL